MTDTTTPHSEPSQPLGLGCNEQLGAWVPVAQRLPAFNERCDWLYQVSGVKRETWMLCGESMLTASVPGNATHWRLAQELPPQAWLCPRCGTDRTAAPCPGGHHGELTGGCPMVGAALGA